MVRLTGAVALCIVIRFIPLSLGFLFIFKSYHTNPHRNRSQVQVRLQDYRFLNTSTGQAVSFRSTEIFNGSAKFVLNRILGPLKENRHENAFP